ncbi:MAG: methyltransferase [bacterium]
MKNKQPEITLKEFWEMSRGFWVSSIIYSGNELGIFDALADGKKSAAQAARKLKLSLRGTEILMDALAAVQLLNKDANGFYKLTSFSRNHLISGSPAYMGNILRHQKNLYESWGRLPEAVKTGKPVSERKPPKTKEGKEMIRNFILGMDDASRAAAEELARKLDLSGIRRALDVGGGPGTYMYAMIRKNPNIRAAIFDLPLPTEIAKEQIRKHKMEGKVDTIVGDFNYDSLGSGYDLVLMSSILHSNSPEQCRRLVRRGADALNPNGMLIINEFALDDSRTSPPHAALFSVNMLVNTGDGRSYTLSEMKEWMKKAGLKNIREDKLLERSTILIGVKK